MNEGFKEKLLTASREILDHLRNALIKFAKSGEYLPNEKDADAPLFLFIEVYLGDDEYSQIEEILGNLPLKLISSLFTFLSR